MTLKMRMTLIKMLFALGVVIMVGIWLA